MARIPRTASALIASVTGAAALVTATLVGGVATAQAATAVPTRAIGTRTAPVPVVSANPDDATPVALDGRVQALAEVAGHVIVGGTFTQFRNAKTSVVITRSYLFSYDKATGRIDAGFAPVLDGQVDVLQASGDGSTVYVAGLFRTVNGVTRPWLVRMDAASGALVTSFNPVLNGRVSDLDLQAGTLYAIGWFARSRTLALGGLAALDPDTGVASPSLVLPLATTRVADGVRTVNVTPDRSRMVVAGNFTSVGGVARDQIAVIDLTAPTASVRSDWSTSRLSFSCAACTSKAIHTYVRDVALSADGRYVVVVTTFYLPGNGDAAIRFEVGATGSDVAPTWVHWTGTDTITVVTLTADGVAYIGGHFRWYGSSPNGALPGRITRWGLAALDADNGMPYEWAPTRERGYGVLAMLVTSDGDLVIGHDRIFVGGEQHSRLAMFPHAGHVVPALASPALPAPVTRVSSTGVETHLTWSGSQATLTSTGTAPTLPGFRAGAMVGSRLMVAATDGFWRMTADSSGKWVRAERLYVNGVNPASVTGLAFQDETLYLTLSGDSNLYARSMNSDSLLVDPYGGVVAGTAIGAGRDYRNARGMFGAGGFLWVAWADGTLDRTPWHAAAAPDSTVAAVKVSGPALDGQSWAAGLYQSSGPGAVASRANLALGAVATQSSEFSPAARAVDGNRDGTFATGSTSSTAAGHDQWLQVDLGAVRDIDAIRIWPRTDAQGEWLNSPWVYVSDVPFTGTLPSRTTTQAGVSTFRLNGILSPGTEVAVGRTGRYVRIQVAGLESAGLQVAELEVLAPSPALP